MHIIPLHLNSCWVQQNDIIANIAIHDCRLLLRAGYWLQIDYNALITRLMNCSSYLDLALNSRFYAWCTCRLCSISSVPKSILGCTVLQKFRLCKYSLIKIRIVLGTRYRKALLILDNHLFLKIVYNLRPHFVYMNEQFYNYIHFQYPTIYQ
jgi:hypothetical protein